MSQPHPSHILRFSILALLIWLCLGRCGVHAQIRFHKTYSSLELGLFPKIQASSDGGWVMVGTTEDFHPNQNKGLAVLRYNRHGQLQWSSFLFASSENMNVASLKIDSRNRILISGYLGDSPSADFYMVYLSLSGNILWSKACRTTEGENPYSIVESTDGNFAVFGIQSPDPASSGRSFIAKVDSAGTFLWANRYFGAGIWGQMISTSDGGYLCRTGSDIYKVDNTGNISWGTSVVFASPTGEPVEVADGYVFPSYSSSIGASLFKLDLNGNLVWVSEQTLPETTHRVKQLPNRNLVTVGNMDVGGTQELVFTEYSPTGEFVRSNRFHRASFPSNYGHHYFDLLPNGGAVAFGLHGSGGAQKPAYLVRTNSLWEVGCGDSPESTHSPRQTLNTSTISASVTNFSIPLQNLNLNQIAINVGEVTECYSCDSIVLDLGADTLVCPDSLLVLGGNVQNAEHYQWSTGDTTDTLVANASGWYWLEATSICDTLRDSIWVEIPIRLVPEMAISPTEATPFDDITIENTSIAYANFGWVLGDGFTSSELSFLHRFQDNGVHKVALWIEDSVGCPYSDTALVDIKFLAYYLPNAFTPNGDGNNDTFGPKADGVIEYQMQVFNRWGKQIFGGNNQNWDGTYQNQPCPSGVYIYQLSLTTIFGNVLYPNGSVTLVR